MCLIFSQLQEMQEIGRYFAVVVLVVLVRCVYSPVTDSVCLVTPAGRLWYCTSISNHQQCD